MKKIVFEKPKDNNPFYLRECPTWYKDAKLGIFIHWGVYSVPAWAPEKGVLTALAQAINEEGYDIDSINSLFSIIPKVIGKMFLKCKFKKLAKLYKLTKTNPYAEWYWNSMYASTTPHRSVADCRHRFPCKSHPHNAPSIADRPDHWTKAHRVQTPAH